MFSIAGTKEPDPGRSDHLASLVVEAQKNPLAFGKLYDDTIQPVYRYLYSRVGNPHDAEDLASQTFLAAYEALPRYREQGRFSVWLFRIARSKLMDYFRRNRFESGLDSSERLAGDGDVLDHVILDEELSRLKALIENLNHDEQDLIYLRYVAGLSFPETAGILGKRTDAVRKSLYRLLARLKSQME